MRVAVMRIRIVGMGVREGIVSMPMCMTCSGCNLLVVGMVVVDVAIGGMNMFVDVGHGVVRMPM